MARVRIALLETVAAVPLMRMFSVPDAGARANLAALDTVISRPLVWQLVYVLARRNNPYLHRHAVRTRTVDAKRHRRHRVLISVRARPRSRAWCGQAR